MIAVTYHADDIESLNSHDIKEKTKTERKKEMKKQGFEFKPHHLVIIFWSSDYGSCDRYCLYRKGHGETAEGHHPIIAPRCISHDSIANPLNY